MILAIQTAALGQLVVQTLKQDFEIEGTTALAIQWTSSLSALGRPLSKTYLNFFLAFIMILNMFALERYAARFQIVFTAVKLLIVLVIICVGIEHIVSKGKLLK